MKKKILLTLFCILILSGFTLCSAAAQDKPISPASYQKLLKRGMDVDWCKTKLGMEHYNVQAVKDFYKMGVRHVRIRIKDEANEALFAHLDQQIEDCLKNNMIPVIAYQADAFKQSPTDKNRGQVVKWWTAVAERYQNKSHRLAFDLVIEVSDALNKKPDALNELYEQTVTAIRATNPTRILMISPRLRSDPQYLDELEIPTRHNRYLMAEWHFYASGPSKTNERKLWTVGSKAEKKLITDKIQLALKWQKKTQIPTWVGAWMPSNYNEGDEYSIREQVVFAQYMRKALSAARIPFAVNSDTQFYDRTTNTWIAQMKPVVNAIYR